LARATATRAMMTAFARAALSTVRARSDVDARRRYKMTSIASSRSTRRATVAARASAGRRCVRTHPTCRARSPSARVVARAGRKMTSERRKLDDIKSMDDFDDFVAREGVQIVLFHASWCRKCKFLVPKLERVSATVADDERASFASVNVNEVPQELVRRCGIEKMPTMQMYEKGEKTWELICGEEGSACALKLQSAVEEALKNLG
jgi:thiol-disulfide isomerase/thioredoxin